jgi:hypothetical protein
VLSPISYKASDLNFDQNKLTPGQLMVLSDFSRSVNSRVTGPIYQMETDSYLWDTYQYVLTNATLARETISSEDPNLVEAMQLLTAKAEDGTVIDSPQMTAYKQYRDAWINATQAYRNQQLTAELSTDPAVKKQWERVDELKLRAVQQQSEDEWVQKGFRHEIDRALQIQQAHAAQSPQGSWSQWDAAFDPSIDLQTDANNQSFALTSYSPQGIVDQPDWLTFHLTRNEINQLATQAPPELRNILATEGSTSPVESLSFEYRSVALTRSWFKPPMFDARFWKLPEGAPEISDGGNPPNGAWPGYAVAVVFVRNITLTVRGPAPATPGPALGKLFTVDRAMMLPQVTMARPRLTVTSAKLHPAATRFGAVGQVRDHRRGTAKRTVPQARSNAAISARLENNVFRPIPRRVPTPPPPPPPPPAPNITTQQGTREEVSILALICKWLPKCPNPDPGLKW